ncbi:MAG: tetratricopeptide repeat protein [Neisseria sp.]|nr:tetratricopeptide repeat protein [Neisseria sp.]
MKKQIIASILPVLLLAQTAWAEPKSEIVRINPPPVREPSWQPSKNALPENMRRELGQAATLVQQHKGSQALPILDKLVKQADAELKKHKNVRAAGNEVHALLLLAEAANSKKDTEVLPAEWLMPRYVRAFVYVEQKDYAAAARDLDNILAVAPYEPQFLGERGQVANAQKDFAAGEKIFKRLIAAAKTLSDKTQSVYFQGMALRGLGYAAAERKQWQAAEQYYRQALKLNPNDRTAKNELVFLLEQQKK